ncbi:EF-hand domain-containing protein [Jannaschia sp. Os4]|uniref:EF-hand domain-containing protein n=1 Tax=Jannaschia sp. Os4 TaxID=2807617 RepID=UPI0019397CFF|nr:EF-hand domain-containing protein [Jannaschia sp. Os4]MBM2577876.1 EF-hand domain-containing protein [Jannaschia sp. Os4]
MTKITLAATAALMALALPVTAQEALDADADGNVTLDEFQVAYPDTSTDVFTTLDSDGDGVLNATEVQAAIDAGVLPG